MSDDQDECMARIEPILKVLHDCLHEGMAFYLDPNNYSVGAVAQQRERTVAGCVNDHAFHRLREMLEGQSGCHFPNVRGLEILNFKDIALVRVKKVNGAGRGRNAQTKQQKDYDAQLPLPGLPLAAVRLVAGYQPDATFTSVQRVIISRPMGKAILWTAQVNLVEDHIAWSDITPSRFAETERSDYAARGAR